MKERLRQKEQVDYKKLNDGEAVSFASGPSQSKKGPKGETAKPPLSELHNQTTSDGGEPKKVSDESHPVWKKKSLGNHGRKKVVSIADFRIKVEVDTDVSLRYYTGMVSRFCQHYGHLLITKLNFSPHRNLR